jgi:hypothetical protein
MCACVCILCMCVCVCVCVRGVRILCMMCMMCIMCACVCVCCSRDVLAMNKHKLTSRLAAEKK